jgi:hypothetical protein
MTRPRWVLTVFKALLARLNCSELPRFEIPVSKGTAGKAICIHIKLRPQRLWPIRNTIPEIGDHGTATLALAFASRKVARELRLMDWGLLWAYVAFS